MIKVIDLDNGIRLVLEPMDSVRSVSIGLWCNTGSANEINEFQGISHYIEHMLFKGTHSRSSFDIVDQIDRVGGQMNAFTGKESTCFYVKCLDEHFDTCADVLTDMLNDPLFDATEMEKEKLVVIEEINMNQDDPDDVAIDNLESIIFENTTMEHPVLGSKETVSAFTQDMMNEYYYSHYTRDAIVVSIAGSYNEEHVMEYFSNKFDRLNCCRDIADKNVPVFGQKNTEIVKDIEQAHIAMGVMTIPASDKRRYTMSLINNIMGGGMSSRLFQNVREKKGLAYSVYSMNGFYSHTGLYVIAAGIAKDRVDEALEAIRIELDRLDSEPIDVSEFESAKEQLKSSYIFNQESVQARMIANGRNLLAFGKCITQEEILENFDSITLQDMESTKKLISNYDNYSIVNVTGR